GHIVTITKNADIRVYVKEGPLPKSVVEGGDPVVPPASAPSDPNATPPVGDSVGSVRAAERADAKIAQWEEENTVYVAEKQTVTTDHRPTNWSTNISEEAVAAIKQARDAFSKSMAVLNAGLALYDLGDQGVSAKTLLNAASALGNTVTAFKALGPLELS